MAELRVGLGALFLAPKRRFMVDAWVCLFSWKVVVRVMFDQSGYCQVWLS